METKLTTNPKLLRTVTYGAGPMAGEMASGLFVKGGELNGYFS
jgi:hypothetical protein